MLQPESYPYVSANSARNEPISLPFLPLVLRLGDRIESVSALVDSGASINVLPYDVGLRLGAVWDKQSIPVRLTGNLSDADARGILIVASVGSFEPVRLAFAWSRRPDVPVLLGQTNFFAEFDVCFFESQSRFEIRPSRA